MMRIVAVLVGIVLMLPAALLFGSHLFVYTVGLKPEWLPEAFAFAALAGVGLIFSGLRVSRN